MKHSAIIDASGADEIAARLEVEISHVRVWKHRGIPRSRYAFLMDAFPEVTLAMLRDGEASQSEAA